MSKVNRPLESALAEMRIVEEALRNSEARLRAVIDSVLDALIIIDAFGTVQDCNPACLRIFGYKLDELIGHNVKVLMGPPYSQEHDDYLRRYREGAEPKVIGVGREVTAKRKDGTIFPIDLSVNEVWHSGEQFFVGIVRDISERKEAERAWQELQLHLNQAQKIEALGNLAGGIAHDFNNALFPIIGLTGLTAARLPENSEDQINLLKVLEAASHAQRLVHQVLAFSRHDPPDQRFEDLGKIMDKAIQFLRASLPSTISLTTGPDKITGLIFANTTQIQQVIINLATNARDAMAQSGGNLHIKTSTVEVAFGDVPDLEPGNYFRVDVSDTGCGMDRAVAERIFEPFFTTKSVDGGHGLGLSVVHGIVKSHNGAVTVESSPGRGTVFSVYLPQAAAKTLEDGADSI